MIGIIGAGAFGTALAVALSSHQEVRLWARDRDQVKDMFASRRTKRLDDVVLPKSVTPTSDLHDLADCNLLLLAVPTQKLRGFLQPHAKTLAAMPLVACCKGIELKSGLSPTEIISEFCPRNPVAILTGPSFANDIARGLPTALTMACRSKELGARMQAALKTDNLRIYRTQDVIGAELGGALKNVMAIACGAVMGAGLGESARAALMTRGFAEIVRLAEARGARPDTLAGLSGFGDLVLTCTSGQSRNYRFGECLGRQEAFDPDVTVEGAATANAMAEQARKIGIDMPVTEAVNALVSGELKVTQAMDMLLSRPLKEE
ncbi:NAD(P)H-dependent glycerol-3-phosphate dehydrogenase [Roseovarius aestuariivivens]|uniref:NAD(P)H-dependent glycerol-3-phosphate dehydrogenase n=1 Tax=Roseovarius aestuariivivens TaxID=1888910 RepID=UPI00108062DE|nr:NAD(P)H-dependent glycerol-3-phosphate dehydrogenase [Roseovarius aestuariivivens]